MPKKMISDKQAEKKRYELRAQKILNNNQFDLPQLGSKSVKLILRSDKTVNEWGFEVNGIEYLK